MSEEPGAAFERLYDAIHPRDGSMPDLETIEVVAEQVHPTLKAVVGRSQVREQPEGHVTNEYRGAWEQPAELRDRLTHAVADRGIVKITVAGNVETLEAEDYEAIEAALAPSEGGPLSPGGERE